MHWTYDQLCIVCLYIRHWVATHVQFDWMCTQKPLLCFTLFFWFLLFVRSQIANSIYIGQDHTFTGYMNTALFLCKWDVCVCVMQSRTQIDFSVQDSTVADIVNVYTHLSIRRKFNAIFHWHIKWDWSSGLYMKYQLFSHHTNNESQNFHFNFMRFYWNNYEYQLKYVYIWNDDEKETEISFSIS